jgi:tRNA (guanine10-N2)-dimethyltransferase
MDKKVYAFELSGEHETLPRSEALALLGIYSKSFKEICCLDQCLLIKSDGIDAAALGQRLAMTHRIIEVLAVCDADPDSLAKAAAKIDLPHKSYCVRAKRIKHAPLPGNIVEREVGRALYRRGYRADLKNPEIEIRAIISDEKVILGREVARPDRSSFEARRPHLKPFFHPGVLMPRMARALVNLSLAMPGEQLLDPFAGTGGILVEACLIGIRGIGVEVQPRLVRGARENMASMDCTLISGDAKRLPFKNSSIESAVLDIPYGRSALIEARSKEDLLIESLSELQRVLKHGRRMVIVADRLIDRHIDDSGFDVLEMHSDRVHGSLTRRLFVCSKR